MDTALYQHIQPFCICYMYIHLVIIYPLKQLKSLGILIKHRPEDERNFN